MRCFSCHALSLNIICKQCRDNLLGANITKRKIGSLDVYSFYSYSSLEKLLLSKHTPVGHRVYRELAKMTFKPFMEHFIAHDARDIAVIGVDERIKGGYSHVALLTHSMRGAHTKVLHASLMANNKVSYSAQSLDYRLANPRDFVYKGEQGMDAILVDDIVTTGTTLSEARAVLQKSGIDVLFALTLADARS